MSIPNDLVTALQAVVTTLDSHGIPYYVGGSIASSFHGVPRSTIDADLVTDLQLEQISPFFRAISTEFYAREATMRDAVLRKSCFNRIHLDTGFKIDIFVQEGRPYDRSAFSRARIDSLSQDYSLRVRICSAEDNILAKLAWYRAGGETSERQWNDVLMVAKIRKTSLDWNYLQDMANGLSVADLLARLLNESET